MRIKFSLPRCSTSPDDMVRLYPRLHWLDQEQSNILLSRRTDREDGTEEGTDTGMSSSTGICHFRFKHWLIKWNIQQRQQYQVHNVSRELPSSSDLEVSYWLSPRNGNPEVFANLQENVDLNVLDPFHSFVSNVPSIIIINVTSLEAFDVSCHSGVI